MCKGCSARRIWSSQTEPVPPSWPRDSKAGDRDLRWPVGASDSPIPLDFGPFLSSSHHEEGSDLTASEERQPPGGEGTRFAGQ